MIELNDQLLSFFFSFLYGVIIAFTFTKSNCYLYHKGIKYVFFNCFMFCLLHTIFYFKIFYIISDGFIHLYFIMITFFSSILFYKYFTKKYVNKR